MPVQQSFCYPCFLKDGIDLDALFGKAAEVGFPAPEMWFRDETFPEGGRVGLWTKADAATWFDDLELREPSWPDER